MKWQRILTVTLLLAVAMGLWLRWRQDEPRRIALAVLDQLQADLASADARNLLETLALPKAVEGKTPVEQAEFIRKALRDEVSLEGLLVLKRNGQYGPLTELFPNEAVIWASQAGVNPEECVAFKLEQSDLRSEVVLHFDGQRYRVVRCNNVKQLAQN